MWHDHVNVTVEIVRRRLYPVALFYELIHGSIIGKKQNNTCKRLDRTG